MTIQYTTTIKQMFTVPNPTGYVVNVVFKVEGTDGTHTAEIYGNITFTPEQNEQGFIPYSQLTQAEVLGWINAATNNQQNYYDNINGQIQSLITPPVSPSSQPLPWSA
jgi:hypothetical protein